MALFDRKTPPRSERTEEERERARAERHARRAGRDAVPGEGDAPPPLETPPSDAAPAPAPRPPAPPAPAAPPVAPAPPPPAPAAPSPARAPTATEERVTPARRSAPVDAPSVVFADEVSEDWSQLDAPPRRTLRRRAPGGGGHGPAGQPVPRRRWPLALLVLAILAILGGGWFAMALFQPLHGDGGDRVSVSIPRGAGVSQAGDILAARGVISSASFFKLRAKLQGTSDIKPGSYALREDTPYGAALAALEKGPPPPKTTDITITEGRTITEANRLLRKTSLRGSYAAAARATPALRPQQFGAPRSIRTKEGFLFPATYKVRVGAPVSDLVAKQLQTFRRQFGTVNLAYARSKKLTPYDILIIASMVEREAGVPKDRRLVASVVYNRLNQSIPLGIDATIRYQLDNWQRPLRMSELERDTPYNTRLNQGLPPTPIGNPGLASIRAAANPARTDFLYFVVKPCGKGEHVFTRTDAEHVRAVQRYEQARRQRGGSPVDC
jgi:peptidoglycan lytic transglycosylase G